MSQRAVNNRVNPLRQDVAQKVAQILSEQAISPQTALRVALSYRWADGFRDKPRAVEDLLGDPAFVWTAFSATTSLQPIFCRLYFLNFTDDQIQKMGARDLMDVLIQILGFTFGSDVNGVVGLAFRGIFGHEGKILLIVDGQEMNEGLYGTLQLGNCYPVKHIKQIEVIRGPGSVIYGGFAELAVINVITKGADDLKGVEADVMYGQMQHTYARRDVSLQAGLEPTKDLKISIRDYSDLNGDTYNFAENSQNDPRWFNLGIQYKGLDFRFIYDGYDTTEHDSYGVNAATALDRFHGTFAGVKYTFKPTDKLSITPYYNFKVNSPFRVTTPNDPNRGLQDKAAYRNRAGVIVHYDFTESINALAGTEVYRDDGVGYLTPDISGYGFQNGLPEPVNEDETQ